MTNEDYEQWKPLLIKLAYTYRNNIYGIETDDLAQIGAMGLMKAIETYDDSKGVSLKTWVFNRVKWAIIREFHNLNRIKRQSEYKTISLSTPTGEEEDTTLEDIISDGRDQIIELEEKLVYEAYEKEINMCILDITKKSVIKKCLFTDLTIAEIGKQHNISRERVRQIQNSGYKVLRKKSPLIREHYLKYKERQEEEYFLSEYINPERIVIYNITSARLKIKYKREIEVLDFIQKLFDFIDGYSFKNKRLKEFLLLKLDGILSETDIEILEKHIFNRESMEVLRLRDYNLYDLIKIKRTVKNKIDANKEYVYNLWENY